MKSSLVSAASPCLGAFVVQRAVTQQPLCEKSFHQSCLTGLLSSAALEELLLHCFWFPAGVSTSKLWADSSDRVPVTCSVAPLWSNCSVPGCGCLWALLLPDTGFAAGDPSGRAGRNHCFCRSSRASLRDSRSRWRVSLADAESSHMQGWRLSSSFNLKCHWMPVSLHTWKFIHRTQTPW